MFSEIRNIKDLSLHLRCSVSDIENARSILQKSDGYKIFPIPKSHGGFRRIIRPLDEKNRNLHKKIQQLIISHNVSIPKFIHGFVKGRSILTNASEHIDSRYILNVDIKNFFESTSTPKVKQVFKDLGCNKEIATILTDICTYDGGLPQGVHTSPVLSNLAFLSVDNKILALAKKYNCKYTRYADDLTFSCSSKIVLKKELENILSKSDYSLNERKTRFQKRGSPQYVTGLSVSDNIQPRIPRRYKRNLRLELYYINKYGIDGHQKYILENKRRLHPFYESYLEGRITYVNSVEPKLAAKLFKVFADAMGFDEDNPHIKNNMPPEYYDELILKMNKKRNKKDDTSFRLF